MVITLLRNSEGLGWEGHVKTCPGGSAAVEGEYRTLVILTSFKFISTSFKLISVFVYDLWRLHSPIYFIWCVNVYNMQ